MHFYTLPKALYKLDRINKILSYDENCILYKKLEYDMLNNERLLTSHAIIYVVNGKVSITTYAGDELIISNNEMLFMPRDSYLISDYVCNSKPIEVFLLFFNHEIVMRFLDGFEIKQKDKMCACKLEVTKNIQYYMENIEKMSFESRHNKSLLEYKLLEFLHLIPNSQKFMQTLEASERGKQKRDIESVMLEHYNKNITIAEFASLSGRSLSTFNREFKQKHHTTPKQWLIKKCRDKAHTLLKEGKSVTDTAFEVGYFNVSNFIKTYKSVYHQTPKVMQKKNF